MKAVRRGDGTGTGGERDDFAIERRSLHERHRFQEWKQQQQQQQRATGGGGFTPAPGTFGTVKTTSQLLQETTQQIQSIGGIGSSAGGTGTLSHYPAAAVPPIVLGQLPPFAASPAWPDNGNAASSRTTDQNRNSWSILPHGDSDDSDDCDTDDNNNHLRQKLPPTPLFHFAPPTFQPHGTVVAGKPAILDDDDDPDL